MTGRFVLMGSIADTEVRCEFNGLCLKTSPKESTGQSGITCKTTWGTTNYITVRIDTAGRSRLAALTYSFLELALNHLGF